MQATLIVKYMADRKGEIHNARFGILICMCAMRGIVLAHLALPAEFIKLMFTSVRTVIIVDL